MRPWETRHPDPVNTNFPKEGVMRKLHSVATLALVAALSVPAAFAQRNSELNNPHHQYPTKERSRQISFGLGSNQNITYHNGPVMPTAHVIPIYWGSTWAAGTDHDISTSLSNFIAAFGQTGEYNTITQYYEVVNGSKVFISKSNLAANGGAIYDSSQPPTNVTDAAIQAEVLKVTGNAPDPTVIYEVFLPSTSYSSDGNATSCGGPHLQYCAYHGNFQHGSTDVKYGSMPYPSCGGCQSSGFTTAQNFEHFISHETREAVTDPDLNAWYDRRGNEADDKCAWSPAPFTDSATGHNVDGSAFAYQYEWSNANSGCVKTR